MAVNLAEALAALDEEKVLAEVKKRTEGGEEPLTILEEARQGMEIVGDKFSSGEYYLGELIYSGEILKQVSALIAPKLRETSAGTSQGSVVIGTVAGDIHDIGKNIVIALLEANGFKVFDLGVDVPPLNFVESIKETGAPIVGLSALLTASIEAIKETVEEIRKAYDGKVKIMIGGAPIDEEVKNYTGADAWCKDAVEGVNTAKKWAMN